MLLAIDIGNTNISLGLFRGNRLLERYSVSSKQESYSACLRKIFSRDKIDDVVICSVVPKVSKVLGKDLRRFLDKAPYILGKDIIVPIKNLYHKPRQVGQDRLVNALAASRLFGAPSIIVDFGTAITFDLVSKRGQYLGGLIIPGLEISVQALYEKTALLPKIKLSKPKALIGKDTKESIKSGIIFGYAGLCDSLIERLKARLGARTKVIATGGAAQLIQGYSRLIDILEPALTLEGIAIIYQGKLANLNTKFTKKIVLSQVCSKKGRT